MHSLEAMAREGGLLGGVAEGVAPGNQGVAHQAVGKDHAHMRGAAGVRRQRCLQRLHGAAPGFVIVAGDGGQPFGAQRGAQPAQRQLVVEQVHLVWREFDLQRVTPPR